MSKHPSIDTKWDIKVEGKLSLVELRETTFTNKEGEERTSLKVTNVHPWDDGKKLDTAELDDDVPF